MTVTAVVATGTAVDAYRQDLARLGRATLGDVDDQWIRVAALLETAAAHRRRAATQLARPLGRRVRNASGQRPELQPRPDLGPLVESADVATAAVAAVEQILGVALGTAADEPRDVCADSTTDAGAAREGRLVAEVVALAERIEAAGALALAERLLASGGEVLPDAPPAARGLLLVTRARLVRKHGDLDYAEDLYREAIRLGRPVAALQVVAQATLGLGVVARVRGNYPNARRAFAEGLRLAARVGRRDLESAAHHGLLVAAAVARDFGTASAHGWSALRLAQGDPAREADILGNLAAIAGDVGDHRAAVRGYLAVASRVTSACAHIPALAGAAASAGALGRRDLVLRLDAAVAREVRATQLPYEEATASVLLAQAWDHLGDSGRADAHRARARALAAQHGFHEFAMTLASEAPSAASVSPVPASRRTRSLSDRRTRAMLSDLATVSVAPEWARDTAPATV